jgi:hypothetical protein
MSSVELLVRGGLWFAFASLGLVRHVVLLSRYRAMTAAANPALQRASDRELLDTPQSDPVLEAARRKCRRWLFAGLALFFLCIPFVPMVFNA